jgi:SRSO17 transposase
MIRLKRSGRDSSAAKMELQIKGWKRELETVHGRIGGEFRRAEPRQRCLRYLQGLLSGCERKNGWQLAEWLGEATPDGVQHLLERARWDADAVRDEVRKYVVEQLGEREAVLIVDETGFVKKGRHSAGVKRQYSGTAGRIENSQIGVFLCYAGPRGGAFLDRELYLPQEWIQDRGRCAGAGIPQERNFATKPELARRMLERALKAGVPCGWVTGDTVYGGDRKLRRWLQARSQAFVLAVACDQRLWWPGLRQQRVDAIAQALPRRSWKRLSCGTGAKGERFYDWARVSLARSRSTEDQGCESFLLVRRSLEATPEYAYYMVYAPRPKATLKNLVRVAGRRWEIEIGFEAAKGECGLDHYEVRRWQGWYRHVTLALLAHAVLAALRARSQKNALKV